MTTPQSVTSARLPRFHLAFPVTDLDAARSFYGEFLGCPEGRSSPECIRFKGLVGEQATMFFLDPFGNAPEFKAFEHIKQLFAKQ